MSAYCNKHSTQQNACAACVKEAVEKQTAVLMAIHECLKYRLPPVPPQKPMTTLQRLKRWLDDRVWL